VYVVDIGGIQTDEHKVIVFDAVDGKHLFDFGKRGTADGEFNLPRDIAIGKDGLLYVVDGGNFRIQVFTPEGVFVRRFGAVGLRSGQFSKPKEIAIGEDGNVYVVDIAFGNFQIFNPQGQVLLAVGGRAETDGPARFMLPQGIAVDKDGRIYMADQFFRKVDVFRPAGLDENAGYAAAPSVKK
jgi:DNA-binding beta-propeller fold protein YncE